MDTIKYENCLLIVLKWHVLGNFDDISWHTTVMNFEFIAVYSTSD